MATSKEASSVETVQCGLIMPISAAEDCSAEHWLEVKSILSEACLSIRSHEVRARLVSEADSVGVIQKRIIQNVYQADIAVCDLSTRNPNVMFELGLRLAFDKPTVLIKDDQTPFSFDTGVIEHLEYPRSLRFAQIVTFKEKLAEKITATFEAAKKASYSSFLKSFGDFVTVALDTKSVTAESAILESLAQLQRDMASLRRQNSRFELEKPRFRFMVTTTAPEHVDAVVNEAIRLLPITEWNIERHGPETRILFGTQSIPPALFADAAEYLKTLDAVRRVTQI